MSAEMLPPPEPGARALGFRPHRCGRIDIRPLHEDDQDAFLAAARRSERFTERWNPVIRSADDFEQLLIRTRSGLQYVFLVIDRATGDVAGKVSVFDIIRSSSQSAALGYDAYLPYAGTGRMTDALRLVVDGCFAPEPFGFGLHRLEINTPPGNDRSNALARVAGFRQEGLSLRFQRLNGVWLDCVRYALTSEERAPLRCCLPGSEHGHENGDN